MAIQLSSLFLFTAMLVHGGSPDVVRIKGSDTMFMLAKAWSKVFMALKPGVKIEVEGGGSGVGIAALLEGSTDICTSSRRMKPKEIDTYVARYGTRPVEFKVAQDGVGILVNESNALDEISLENLKMIYNGTIRNWKVLGGADEPIHLFGRNKKSGTYAFIKEDVLSETSFDSSMTVLETTAEIVQAVAATPGGIGYGGSAYGKRSKELRIRKDQQSTGYFPTFKNIHDGLYPLSRYLYLYVSPRPQPPVENFIQWTLGNEGQELVVEAGYLPISK